MLGISVSNVRVGGFRGKGIDADATTIYNRIIADGGVSNLTRLNFFVKGLKAIYGTLANVPVCYDAHWIGYKLGSGTGATAGQAAAKLYSLTVAADAVQATAASQPLLLAHNGDNYWYGSGVAGNYCSTPNASANQITGDIELKACINIGAIVGGDGLTPLICKSNSYYMLLYNNYALKFYNGTTVSAATTTIPTNTTFTKITRSSSTGDINFYTSTESITTNINSVTWTKLGATVSSTSGNLPSSSGTVYVGADGGAWSCLGKIYRATISNSIGGAPVVDFNPATYNAATSQTAWTSATGEIWTINTGTANTGYKSALVSRTIVQGDGVDDAMETANSVWGGISSVYSAIAYINLNSKGGTSVDSDLANFAIQKYEGIDTFNLYSVFQGGLNINKDITSRKNLNTLYNSIRNGTSSAVNFNNGTDTTGTLNTAITTGVRILSSRTSAAYTNGNLNTILISGSADNATTRTATYNLIRSLNENAF